jgi:hypothetical protein
MSALTSLLVRDDAVSVRQIEEALARQVVDGGELDTALLELGALPENKLIAYRAASERSQAATREDVMGASTDTRALLPSELAVALHVAPLRREAGTLLVASARALKAAEIAQLADRAGMQISVRITVELRVLAALADFYGHPLPPRLATLRARVDAQPSGELVSVLPLQQSVQRSMKTEQLPAFEEAEDFQAVLAAAFERASMSPHAGTPAVDPDETRPLSTKRAFEVQRKRHASRPSEDTAKLGTSVMESRAPGRSGTLDTGRSSVRPSAPPQPGEQLAVEDAESKTEEAAEPSPPTKRLARISYRPTQLSAAAVSEALANVEDRDAVLDIYFRFARQFFAGSILFTLKDGRMIGVQSHNVKHLPDVREISLPIVRGSSLEELTRTLVPRVVDLTRKDEDRTLGSTLKRLDAQPAALVPVCIKRRVVAVVYGDRGGDPLHQDELTELLSLMPAVTTAFERIIRARKAAGLSVAPSHIGELSHAPTQRSMPAQSGFSSEARTAQLPDHSKQALEALKIPRALPGAGAPSFKSLSFDDDGDIYATARIPIQPLPLEQFDSPPRFLSKPPPGAGRYQSLAPKGPGAEEVLRPQSDHAREERTSNSRRPPPDARRSDVSGVNVDAEPARRRSAAPPPGRSVPPAQRRSAAPPAASTSVSNASLAAPKPAPGSGVYHSHIGTTEMISVPGARREGINEPPPAKPAADPTQHHDAGAGFFLRGEAKPTVHEEAELASRAAKLTRSSVPPKTSSRPSAVPSQPSNRVSQLIDELCRSEPGEDSPAVKGLVACGEPALTQLLTRFPGPLWFDRRKPHARVPLGRDISPICRALDAFGDQAVERLIPLLGSNTTEVRYYATLFAGDRVRPSLLDALLTRLFDDDPQIRLLVRDALPHYRKFPGFARVTERLCQKARAESAPLYERLAALDAISVLRDAGSVSALIELIGHQDKQICVPAHRALSLITCQDFGKTPRKWRSWLSANSDRHRVEWLIDGLMHSEESMRATAGLELQKLTQVYYGYVAAASKKEREAAQKRYAEWWRTEGRARLGA